MHERDGSWHAWILRVKPLAASAGHQHHVVSVRADTVRQLESPSAYTHGLRRILGTDVRSARGPLAGQAVTGVPS